MSISCLSKDEKYKAPTLVEVNARKKGILPFPFFSDSSQISLPFPNRTNSLTKSKNLMTTQILFGPYNIYFERSFRSP